MYFSSIEFTDFLPFAKGSSMEFAPVPDKPEDLAEVHLLTGENGTGKSRLLCLLAAALGDANSLRKRKATAKSTLTFRGSGREILPSDAMFIEVGRRTTSISGALTSMVKSIPTIARSGSSYVGASEDITATTSLSDRLNFGETRGSSPGFLNLFRNAYLQARLDGVPRMVNLLRRLNEEIGAIIGNVEFAVRTYPKEELQIKWHEREPLSLSQCPDGLKCIAGALADTFLTFDRMTVDRSNEEGEELTAFNAPSIILLDEIETHLHPSWQWKLLPAFQRIFPKAQIFVATHSPFVIASLNKGTIHRLRRGADGVVDDPRPAQEGDSYESALEDIQDVKQRFDPESEALLEGFYKQRSAALRGDKAAEAKARELVKAIARRGPELEDIIGRESRQMERQLKDKPAAAA
jgi:energy-coupling factor transporter ATP-binding protein EcfA2